MRIFFDTEFTGLHQDTTLISIGMVTEDGRELYCELNDYDKSQVDDWLTQNVISKLHNTNPISTDQAFDLCTLFKVKGIDPDINRERFSGMVDGKQKHNALWDANVIRECYNKAIQSSE